MIQSGTEKRVTGSEGHTEERENPRVKLPMATVTM